MVDDASMVWHGIGVVACTVTQPCNYSAIATSPQSATMSLLCYSCVIPVAYPPHWPAMLLSAIRLSASYRDWGRFVRTVHIFFLHPTYYRFILK